MNELISQLYLYKPPFLPKETDFAIVQHRFMKVKQMLNERIKIGSISLRLAYLSMMMEVSPSYVQSLNIK
jgi:hypothetical protein